MLQVLYSLKTLSKKSTCLNDVMDICIHYPDTLSSTKDLHPPDGTEPYGRVSQTRFLHPPQNNQSLISCVVHRALGEGGQDRVCETLTY